jgi:hypothetical protein
MNKPFNFGRTCLLKNDWFLAAPGTYTRYPHNLGRCDGTGVAGIVKETFLHFIDEKIDNTPATFDLVISVASFNKAFTISLFESFM